MNSYFYMKPTKDSKELARHSFKMAGDKLIHPAVLWGVFVIGSNFDFRCLACPEGGVVCGRELDRFIGLRVPGAFR